MAIYENISFFFFNLYSVLGLNGRDSMLPSPQKKYHTYHIPLSLQYAAMFIQTINSIITTVCQVISLKFSKLYK